MCSGFICSTYFCLRNEYRHVRWSNCIFFLIGNYLLNFNNGNTGKMCETCSKSISHYVVLIVNFEQISQNVLVFLFILWTSNWRLSCFKHFNGSMSTRQNALFLYIFIFLIFCSYTNAGFHYTFFCLISDR